MELDPETDIFIEKTLKSPRMKIWECLTTPEHIKEFYVPKPHTVIKCELDLRPGGRFNTTFLVDGNEIDNQGVFLEVVEGKKLVFTDGYLEGWKPVAEPFMTGIVLLEDSTDGGTVYKAIARHRTSESRQSHAEMGFVEGWGIVADQLDEYASGLT